MSPAPAPLTTLVVNRAAGPRTARAATAVAIFVVEAGWNAEPAFAEYSTWPVARSVTSTPTCGPSAPERSTGPSAVATPAGVAAAPVAGAADPSAAPPDGASTAGAETSGRGATRGTSHRARPCGSTRATVTPAPMVNTQSSASEATARRWSRRTGGPFAAGRPPASQGGTPIG